MNKDRKELEYDIGHIGLRKQMLDKWQYGLEHQISLPKIVVFPSPVYEIKFC